MYMEDPVIINKDSTIDSITGNNKGDRAKNWVKTVKFKNMI